MGLQKDEVVAILGAGAMGQGIAQVAAAAGHRVLLFDTAAGSAERAIEMIDKSAARLVEKGKLEAAAKQDLIGRIEVAASLPELAPAGVAIEAIVEDMAAKAELFLALEHVLGDSALLATNTSSLSVTEIAGHLKRPERFAGVHFFNPAPVMQLVEVVSGLRTSDATLDALCALVRSWGKEAVVVRNAPGFIVNRGARPFYSEPLKFAEENGADFPTIDALFEGNGFKMGPLKLIDLIGLDINLSASRSMWQAYYSEPRYKPSRLVEERVAAGFLGKKSGRGFYDYASTSAAESKFLLGAPSPTEVTIYGDVGPASPIFDLCRAKGIEVDRSHGEGWIGIDGARVALADGSFAGERGANWAVFDLCLDWGDSGCVALTGQDKSALLKAAGLFQALGKSVVQVEDLPGMLMARTICMLINEACETVLNGVAGEEDVDLAMRKGLNFPGGPFEWLRKLGPAYVMGLLDRMAASYGDPRYRASIYLRRMTL